MDLNGVFCLHCQDITRWIYSPHGDDLAGSCGRFNRTFPGETLRTACNGRHSVLLLNYLYVNIIIPHWPPWHIFMYIFRTVEKCTTCECLNSPLSDSIIFPLLGCYDVVHCGISFLLLFAVFLFRFTNHKGATNNFCQFKKILNFIKSVC